MQQFTLEREDKGPLVFNGARIAHVSTWAHGKERWTELTLYSVEPSKPGVTVRWVVESLGQTTVRGEKVFHSVVQCSKLEELIATLSKDGSVSGPGMDLLDDAAEEDALISAYMDKVFGVEERL